MFERSFGHFARVLVDMDLTTMLRYKVLVERQGHDRSSCKRFPIKNVETEAQPKKLASKKGYVVTSDANKNQGQVLVDLEAETSKAVNVAINNSKTRRIDEVINVDEPETDTVIVELHNQNLETETEMRKFNNVDIPVDVQNDINFLKQSWANMTELADGQNEAQPPFQQVLSKSQKKANKKENKTSFCICSLHHWVKGEPWMNIDSFPASCLRRLNLEIFKIWNKEVFGNVHDQLKKAKDKVNEIQHDISTNGHSDLLMNQEKQAQVDLELALNIEEAFWKEKAKIKWSLEGDRNTKFFHRDDGIIDEVILNLVNSETNNMLTDFPSMEEVHHAVFALNTNCAAVLSIWVMLPNFNAPTCVIERCVRCPTRVSDLLVPLDVSSDDKVLPTTYGIETSTWQASIEGMVPYHNALHHHIESIILSCLESKADAIVDHLLQVDKQCVLCAEGNQRTVPAAGKRATRVGNIDHITRVANKLIHLVHNQSHILAHLQVRFLYIRGTRFMVFIVSTK
ncbi:serine/threonine-protein phosphatase 6 regulatory [Trifolium pratense]|uniref:Serine/threonine-protein phosphatase 6 regulatory n=1 Tax=Trifolium pratense TaxID=57577 RepID=A0A2K3NMT6_TRIPR|nr:serine/threonine-protein phosphatase 6 regulatory [Trifolium pratense]